MTEKKRILAIAAAAVLALSLLAATGCRRVPIEQVDGELTRETKAVPLGAAESASVHLEMAVGTFKLDTDAPAGTLMSGEFEYRPASWAPQIDYSVEATAGTLRVTQPRVDGFNLGRAQRNTWDVSLANDVPVDLSVTFGAGEASLDLGDSLVRTLRVAQGAGDTTIDLSGEWRDSMSADITAGVGALKIKVPEDVGVRVTGKREGVGDFRAEGLTADGDTYVNDAYDTSDVKLEINVVRGVGEVVIETVP